jgi:drug/metabolite transporter (DMT)-like permease
MKKETKAWVFLILLSLIWGSSFILMEKAMFPKPNKPAFTALQVGALRTLIASLVLLPIALKNLKFLTKNNLIFLILVGACGNFLPAFLFPIAETEIQSSLAGLINMGTSIFVVVLGYLFFKTKITLIQLIGLFLGAVSLFMIIANQINTDKNNFYYAGLALLATFFYAISLSVIKYKLHHLKPLTITSLAFFTMLLPSILSAFITGSFTAVVNSQAYSGLPYLLILSVVGTALAVLLFNYMVSFSTPLFASSVVYFIPIVALILGVLDGEHFNSVNYLWICLVFLGVYLMGKK